MRAVVLHSGGLDSTTLLSQAIQDGAESVLAVSVMYGSLHNQAEAAAADVVMEAMIAAWPEVEFDRLVYTLPSEIFQGGSSALMGESRMPALTYQQIRESEGPSPTVVPFRNANLLSVATSVAASRDFDAVYIGAHGDDAHEWAYPDCTPEFLGAMANAIFIGTYNKVRLSFPFIWMTKGQIVALAAVLGAPLEYTWSCYNPVNIPNGHQDGMEFVHCGKCPTCIERANAFAEAGFVDPTSYMVDLQSIVDIDLDDLEEWPL